MFDEPARVLSLDIPAGRRILVVSDIHGNLPYFRGVLERTGFSDRDELIVDGDFLEKGPDSLGTLRFLMALCERGNVHPLLGNCDSWDNIFLSDGYDEQLLRYVLWRKSGLLWDMLNVSGIDPFELESITACKCVAPDGIDNAHRTAYIGDEPDYKIAPVIKLSEESFLELFAVLIVFENVLEGSIHALVHSMAHIEIANLNRRKEESEQYKAQWGKCAAADKIQKKIENKSDNKAEQSRLSHFTLVGIDKGFS